MSVNPIVAVAVIAVWLYILSVLTRAKLYAWKFMWGSFGLFLIMMITIRPVLTMPLARCVSALAGVVGSVTGAFTSYFKNEKLWCAVAGAAAVIVGKKILKADKTRSLAVTGLAKGMKLQKDAKAAFQNMKDEASDICYDAKTEAGIHEDAAAEEVTE